MKRGVLYAIGGVVLLAIALLVFQGSQRATDAAWQADVERVLADARAERARADSALLRAVEFENAAGIATMRADSLARRAAALASVAARIRSRIDTVRVPESALPYTAPRDSLIVVLGHQVDTLGAALRVQREAGARLGLANHALRATVSGLLLAHDSMTAVLERRPHARWWVPSLTMGVSAGVDARDLKVFAGPAVQLGWRLHL